MFAAACLGEEAPPRVPAHLEESIGMARALPAEFAADILLQAASRLGTRHRVKTKALLEDAFALAERARQPMPQRAVMPASADSEDAILESAYAKGLDRLSLQARAVRQMHALDARLGAEYFDRLAAPPSDAHTCADRMVWDSSPYWEAAAALKRTSLRGIMSPLEIGPASRALVALKLENSEAATQFLSDVDRLSGDDRAFFATLRTAPRELETFAIDVSRAGGDPAPVLRTLARYLTRHLTARRCADTLEPSRPIASSFVWYYNDRLRVAGYLSKAELPAIREDETVEGGVMPAGERAAKPEWMEAFQELRKAGAEAVAQSKLYDTHPLLWWLVAQPLVSGESHSHPVLSAYARLGKAR